jgi:carotenoid cleavage dioxygenase-like enzyme
VLFGVKSFGQSLRWRPELGTGVLVFDRETLALVARAETDPWFQWHFGNGAALDDGAVVLDLVRYQDVSVTRLLAEVTTGRVDTHARPTLWRLVLDPRSARVQEQAQVLDRPAEFPLVAPAEVGRPWRRTFAVLYRSESNPAKGPFDALGCLDYGTGALVEADLGGRRSPSEPILAPDATAGAGVDGEGPRHWLLSVVYDAANDAGELWIYDAARLADGPVCVLELPAPIPLSFHGTWAPAAEAGE